MSVNLTLRNGILGDHHRCIYGILSFGAFENWERKIA